MAGEDVIIRIGADISAAKSQIDTLEALLKNRSAFGKVGYQLGIDNKTLRANINSSIADAQRIVDSKPLDLTIKDTSGLPRIRYALYDISNALQNVSSTAVNSVSAVVNAAASYETAFTRVEQTTGANATQAAVLRRQLEQLASQIPLTFQDLSGIATLGAQMGIAQADIQAFTKNIAEFTSVTGISAETAAQNFGTIGELLGVSANQYANLGSAIVKTGFESQATESEILSVATQISGVASASKLSAQYVVGLSATLASLKVPAEQSRGALTKVFQTVNMAAAAGGKDLQNFATVLGVSADEAARLSQQDMGTFMNKFIAGLTNISKTAGPAGLTGTLDALGLSELRVTNTLTRLAQAPELFAKNMQNSNQAFADGTVQGEAYKLKIDDIASRFQLIQNNFQTLMATIGQMTSGPIKLFADVINAVIVYFQNLVNSPVGPWLIGLGALMALLVTIVASVVSTLALMFAGIFAVRTALAGLAKDTTFATSKLAQFTMGLFGVAAGEGAATVGARVLSVALKALPVIGVISAITGLIGLIQSLGPNANNAGLDISSLEKAQKDAAKAAKAQQDAINGASQSMNNLGASSSKAAAKVRTLVDYANDLSSTFSRAFDIRFSGQSSLDNITKSWASMRKEVADTNKTMADAQQKIIDINTDINALNADIQGLTADRAMKEYFLSIANAYGDTARAQQIAADIAKIDADIAKKKADLAKKNNDLASTNNDLTSAQESANKTLVGNSDAAIKNRSEILNLVKSYQDHIKALAQSGMSQDQLAITTQQLQQDFISQATQLGYNADELSKYSVAFQDTSKIIDNIPRDITVAFNGDPALTAINEFAAKANEALNGIGAGGLGGWKTKTDTDLNDTETKVSEFAAKTEAMLKYSQSNIEAANLASQGRISEAFRVMQDGLQYKATATKDIIARLTQESADDTKAKINALPGTVQENADKAKNFFAQFANSMPESINSNQPAVNSAFAGIQNSGQSSANNISGSFGNMASSMPNQINAQSGNVKWAFKNTAQSAGSGWSWGFDLLGAAGAALRKLFGFSTGGIVEGYASGGAIYGAGTSTSDSIPAMLSNGEYVIQASAVKQYGVGFFDQLNQMKAPQYASGGAVSYAQPSNGITIVELSPYDRKLLAAAGNVQLRLDGKVVAQATNVNNIVSAQRGSN